MDSTKIAEAEVAAKTAERAKIVSRKFILSSASAMSSLSTNVVQLGLNYRKYLQ